MLCATVPASDTAIGDSLRHLEMAELEVTQLPRLRLMVIGAGAAFGSPCAFPLALALPCLIHRPKTEPSGEPPHHFDAIRLQVLETDCIRVIREAALDLERRIAVGCDIRRPLARTRIARQALRFILGLMALEQGHKVVARISRR